MPVLLFFSLCFIILLFFLISSPSPSFSLSLSYSFSSLPLILILFLFCLYFLYDFFDLKRYKTTPSGRNGKAEMLIKSRVGGTLATGAARRYRWRRNAAFCAWYLSKFDKCFSTVTTSYAAKQIHTYRNLFR